MKDALAVDNQFAMIFCFISVVSGEKFTNLWKIFIRYISNNVLC